MRTDWILCVLVLTSVLPNVRPDDLDDYTDADESGYNDLDHISISDFELAEDEVEQEFGPYEAESSDSGGFSVGSILRGLLSISSAQAAEIIDLPPPIHWKTRKTDNFESLFERHKELNPILDRFEMGIDHNYKKFQSCKHTSGLPKAICYASLNFMVTRKYIRSVYSLVKHGWTKDDIIRLFKILWNTRDHPLLHNIDRLRIFGPKKRLNKEKRR